MKTTVSGRNQPGGSGARRAALSHRVVHAERALDRHDVRGSLEGCGRPLTGRAPTPDRLEELFEPGRCHHPEHHEVFVPLIDDLVLDVVTEEARGAGYQPMRGAVHDHAAAAAEADLQLDLFAVRVLPDTPARRDALEAQREAVEASARGEERGIG